VLDVHYEETVGGPRDAGAAILAHCGLPFEEAACVSTRPSARRDRELRAGRQPLYTRALGTGGATKSISPWQEELADIIAELPESVRERRA
jgi:hypothetical protein